MELTRDRAIQWGLYPIGLATLFGCVVFATLRLLRLLQPAWDAPYLLVICVVVAMEAYYVSRVLQWLPPGALITPWHIRAAELGTWFAVLLLIGDLLEHHGLLSGYGLYMPDSLAIQFTLVAIVWFSAGESARDFGSLGSLVPSVNLASGPVERLTARFFRGGAVLLLVSGLTTVRQNDLARLTDFSRPSVPGIVLNVLIYFVVGAALLVQVRFERLDRLWRRREVKVSSGIANRWFRYSTVLLLVGMLFAIVLPTEYTTSILDVLRGALNAIVAALAFIGFLIAWPIFWLLSLLHLHTQTRPHPAPQHHAPPLHPQPSHPSNLIEILRAIIFWGVFGAVFIYLLRAYGSYLPRTGFGAVVRAVLAAVGGFWSRLWVRLLGYGSRVHIGRRSARQAKPGATRSRPTARRPLFPWRLSPRDQIIWYYASLIHRAGRRGTPRSTGQTPYEYRDALEPRVPSAQDDLVSLTGAYVEARYSPRTVEAEAVPPVRTAWRRILAALRHKR